MRLLCSHNVWHCSYLQFFLEHYTMWNWSSPFLSIYDILKRFISWPLRVPIIFRPKSIMNKQLPFAKRNWEKWKHGGTLKACVCTKRSMLSITHICFINECVLHLVRQLNDSMHVGAGKCLFPIFFFIIVRLTHCMKLNLPSRRAEIISWLTNY